MLGEDARMLTFEVKVSNLIYLPVKWLVGLFLDIPYIKKRVKKNGYSSKEEVLEESRNVVNNSETGFNITLAGVHMGGLLVFLEYSIFNFFQAIIEKPLIQYVVADNIYLIIFIILLLIPPWVINYLTLFKEDRYLEYFREFKKLPKRESRKFAWLSLLSVLGVFLILISSFLCLGYNAY